MKELRFCEMCRKDVPEIGDLQFVEENSDRGFCSEPCILEFYRPFMRAFEIEENNFRSLVGVDNISDSRFSELATSPHYLNVTLSHPDEVWQSTTDIGQKFYTHIKKVNFNGSNVFNLLICSYADGGPSFVYYRLATQSEELLKLYQRDVQFSPESLDDIDEELENFIGDQIPAEIIEVVELKKSQYLAEILAQRQDSDIQIEDFFSYDSCLDETIKDPDEIFQSIDDDDDTINTFIKSFQREGQTFFYIAIAMQFSGVKSNDESEVGLIPILGFPSIDKATYSRFAVGERVIDNLKN